MGTGPVFVCGFCQATHGVRASNGTHDLELLHEPADTFEVVGEAKMKLKGHFELSSAFRSSSVPIGFQQELLVLAILVLPRLPVKRRLFTDKRVVTGTGNLSEGA